MSQQAYGQQDERSRPVAGILTVPVSASYRFARSAAGPSVTPGPGYLMRYAAFAPRTGIY